MNDLSAILAITVMLFILLFATVAVCYIRTPPAIIFLIGLYFQVTAMFMIWIKNIK